MTFTADYTNYIGQMRLVIPDRIEAEAEFSDEELTGYYNMAFQDVLQGSLMALFARVGDYAKYAGDEYRVDTLEYNEGKAKATTIQAMYRDLKQSIEDGSHPMLSVSAHTYGIYTDEYNENIQRMNDGEIIPPRTFDRECNQVNTKMQDGPYYNGG